MLRPWHTEKFKR